MNCTNHPETEAKGVCSYCGKPFCGECLVEVKGKLYCKEDLGNVLDEAKRGPGQPQINITNANANANLNYGGPHGPTKSKVTALILCLVGFLGIAGLHRMYVGKVGSGVFHLFTCGICWIGTIIDLISILSGGFRDSYGYPLT